MAYITHIPYYSLEQFRNSLVEKYLNIYNEDVVVQEKIHGSNIVIYGRRIGGSWFFKLGSRKKWITEDDKFNNFQTLFKNNEVNIRDMFTYLVEKNEFNNAEVRIYGEIFGGKYGQESAPNAMKTQKEPNYCPNNDFAFFDIFIRDLDNSNSESIKIPIMDSIATFEKFNIKFAPIVFKGKLNIFLSIFDINKFTSIVSMVFYNLDYIESERGTEGVTIRSVNPQSPDEEIVLKYKQPWAVENRRVFEKKPKIVNNVSDIEELCLDMMNNNRIDSYNSKNTIDDMTNPRLIGSHMREIIDDTIKDIKIEFPSDKYPDLNLKKISGLLSKRGFPILKEYIKNLENASMPPEVRIQRLIQEQDNIVANVNILSNRLQKAIQKLKTLENM
jgi:hypothetical protein